MPKIVNTEVGSIGFGLMGFTWRPVQTPDEQAFETMKTALSLGANFWNSGEFYGSPEPTLNLQLLKRYFTKYPEDADKVVLSVKGGIDIKRLAPTGGAAAVKASVDNIIRHLGGTKTLDIFECARVDPNTPIEETIGALAECVKEGKIRAIGLSEASAATIRRAHAVHPIAGVELEVSLWSTEIFDNGIADTCKELGIPIVAYSPLGRGFLAGQLKSLKDLPENDSRRNFERFHPGNFEKNLELATAAEKIAARAGIAPSQLALAWVTAQGKKRNQVIIPIPGATRKDRVNENMKNVSVSDEDLKELDDILGSIEIVGGRYNSHSAHLLLV